MEKIKMQETEPYIDLSLKLMNRTDYKAKEDELARVRKINVTEASSSAGTNESDANENPSAKNPTQMRQNSNKSQAVRVSKISNKLR